MKKNNEVAADVDKYIASFPPATRKMLEQLRSAIKKTVPAAVELISYQMPAYKYKGVLVYFGGYEKHIGFYPTPSVIEAFKKELSVYKIGKGSIQFPLDKPLPLPLIRQMVKFRALQNEEKAG